MYAFYLNIIIFAIKLLISVLNSLANTFRLSLLPKYDMVVFIFTVDYIIDAIFRNYSVSRLLLGFFHADMSSTVGLYRKRIKLGWCVLYIIVLIVRKCNHKLRNEQNEQGTRASTQLITNNTTRKRNDQYKLRSLKLNLATL